MGWKWNASLDEPQQNSTSEWNRRKQSLAAVLKSLNHLGAWANAVASRQGQQGRLSRLELALQSPFSQQYNNNVTP